MICGCQIPKNDRAKEYLPGQQNMGLISQWGSVCGLFSWSPIRVEIFLFFCPGDPGRVTVGPRPWTHFTLSAPTCSSHTWVTSRGRMCATAPRRRRSTWRGRVVTVGRRGCRSMWGDSFSLIRSSTPSPHQPARRARRRRLGCSLVQGCRLWHVERGCDSLTSAQQLARTERATTPCA